MKNRITFLFALVLTALVAAIAPGAAKATNCNTGGTLWAGATYAGVPGNNTPISAQIEANTASYQQGTFRSFVKVTNDVGDGIQAGLISKGSGLQEYAEYDGTYLYTGTANKNTWYTPSITKVSTGVWNISLAGGGHTFYDYNLSLSNANQTQFYTTNNQTSACNLYSFSFGLLEPWTGGYGAFYGVVPGPLMFNWNSWAGFNTVQGAS